MYHGTFQVGKGQAEIGNVLLHKAVAMPEKGIKSMADWKDKSAVSQVMIVSTVMKNHKKYTAQLSTDLVKF